jgi:pyrrolidone-carboxylate peptidase
MEIRVLIVCFDGEKNPANLLLNKLREKLGEVKVEYLLLKSSYKMIKSMLEKSLLEYRPKYVMMFGVAFERRCVNIERFALNFDDSAKKDCDGQIRQNRVIIEDGKIAYMTNFSVDELRKEFKKNGLNVRMSNYAGGYLCAPSMGAI